MRAWSSYVAATGRVLLALWGAVVSVEPYYTDESVTLYHGDALELLPRLLGDVPALRFGALVMDPPYGMAFRSGRNGAFAASEIAGDADTRARDVILALWPASLPALVFGRWSVPRPSQTRMVLTWDKGEHVGMGDLALPWKPNTEEIYVLGSGFSGHRGSSGLRYLAIAGTVGQAGDGSRLHPVEKPVPLLQDLIAKCPPGAIIDPFCGSGSTLRAAKNLGRPAVGVEIEERYCEVAARRLAQEVLELTA